MNDSDQTEDYDKTFFEFFKKEDKKGVEKIQNSIKALDIQRVTELYNEYNKYLSEWRDFYSFYYWKNELLIKMIILEDIEDRSEEEKLYFELKRN